MAGDLHTQRGKWSEATVPHKGWSCVGVDDLEEPSQVCEMCESVDQLRQALGDAAKRIYAGSHVPNGRKRKQCSPDAWTLLATC